MGAPPPPPPLYLSLSLSSYLNLARCSLLFEDSDKDNIRFVSLQRGKKEVNTDDTVQSKFHMSLNVSSDFCSLTSPMAFWFFILACLLLLATMLASAHTNHDIRKGCIMEHNANGHIGRYIDCSCWPIWNVCRCDACWELSMESSSVFSDCVVLRIISEPAQNRAQKQGQHSSRQVCTNTGSCNCTV